MAMEGAWRREETAMAKDETWRRRATRRRGKIAALRR
ncbi:hypothetical protein CsSME_00019394 [Camellia sinensis var. sinensis]